MVGTELGDRTRVRLFTPFSATKKRIELVHRAVDQRFC